VKPFLVPIVTVYEDESRRRDAIHHLADGMYITAGPNFGSSADASKLRQQY
jgi:hypothetical protein